MVVQFLVLRKCFSKMLPRYLLFAFMALWLRNRFF